MHFICCLLWRILALYQQRTLTKHSNSRDPPRTYDTGYGLIRDRRSSFSVNQQRENHQLQLYYLRCVSLLDNQIVHTISEISGYIKIE